MRRSNPGLSLAAAVLLAATQSAVAADGRFDAVTIFGGVSNIEIEPSAANDPQTDTDGPAFGASLRKSLFGPVFVEGSYQYADIDPYRIGNFILDQEITRYAVGVGAHSDEDARWIGFWRMDFAGIDFSVTESGQGDTEDGFALNAGVIVAATPWLDFNASGGFLGLDELSGFDVSGGVEINVVPEVTLGGSLRYSILEDDAGNEFRDFTPLLRASYRFGGKPLFASQ